MTRYQYLVLAWYLAKLRQVPRYHGTQGPSMASEGEWRSWDEFYRDSSAALGQAVDATAFEACDCHRQDVRSGPPREPKTLETLGAGGAAAAQDERAQAALNSKPWKPLGRGARLQRG